MPVRVDRLRTLVCSKQNRRKNAIIFLTTFGGDADSAYRLSACLRRNYRQGTVRAYIFGLCKSAGTLAVLGTDEIVLGDFGELGPLDVQLTKPDEVYSTSSGLDIFQAMGVLTNSAFEAYQSYFDQISENWEGHISAKTSAEIARQLTVGLFAPMTGQIEPERLGEVQRAMNIANVYGSRMDRGNLKKDALKKLVQGYPTHGFVIDIDEARTLFNRVRVADPLEREVATHLASLRWQTPEPIISDLVDTHIPKGPANVVRKKAKTRPAKRARRAAVPQAGPGRVGNVAQLRRRVRGNAALAQEDGNARVAAVGGIRPTIKPPGQTTGG